jgi:DNA repair exonuclease SbcCD ATPase subunit
LARTLWLLQRCPGEAWAVSDPVRDRLQEALGSRPAAPERTQLGALIEREYGKSFTPKSGLLAQDAPLSQAQAGLKALTSQLEELEQRHRQAQDYETQLDGLEDQAAQLEAEATGLAARREELSQAARVTAEERAEVEKLQRYLEVGQQEHKRLQQAQDRYAQAEEKQSRLQRELEDLESRLQAAQIGSGVAMKLREQAEVVLEKARESARAARLAYDDGREVGKARRLADQEQKLVELTGRLEELGETEAARRREYEGVVWPQAADAEKARELEINLRITQAQLASSGLSLQVQLLRDQKLQLTGDESKEESHEARAGEVIPYRAGRRVTLTLPDVASVEITSGAQETAQLAESMQETRRELQDLLLRFGAAEVSELAERVRQGEGLKGELAELRKEIKRTAGEYRDLAGARARLAQLVADLDGCLAKLGVDRLTLGGLAVEPEEDLGAKAKRAEELLQEADQAAADRRRELEESMKAEQSVRTKREETSGDVKSSETERATILQGAECATPEELDKRRAEAEAEVAVLQGRVEALQAQLPDEMTDPERLLRTNREALEQVEEGRTSLRDRVVALETKLEASRQGDLYSLLEGVSEQVEEKRRDVQVVLRRTWAIQLLRALYEKRHEGGDERIWQAVEEKMGRMARAVSSRSQRRVRLSNDLGTPTFCDLEMPGEAGWVSGTELSSGTREQMELLYRLALGEVYAEKFGRQMLVLDDVLVYTDPERYGRMLEILKIGAERLQIFVLTSHPQFYRGMVPEQFVFDLPALVATT